MSSTNGCESTVGSKGVSENLEAFVKECETEFGDRYTENDADYKKLKETGIGKPPIVEPWYSKQRRNFDWAKRARPDSNRHEDSHRQRDSSGQGDSSSSSHSNRHRRDDYRHDRPASYRGHRHRPY